MKKIKRADSVRNGRFILVGIVFFLCTGALLLYYYRNQHSALEIAIQQYKDGKYKDAFHLFLPLAKKGNAKAQFYIGNMFYFGKGLKKDDSKAFALFRLAARKNLSAAHNNLSTCYFYGIGTAKDAKKGLTYLQIASLEGQPVALLRLGSLYYNGDSVGKNHLLAFYCFQKAAEKNNPQAQYMLGRMYFEGAGVAKNLDKGDELMHIAAKNGEFAAQLYVAFGYLQENNMDLARKWLSILKKRGDIPEETIQKFLHFGKLLQEDAKKAEEYFNQIKTFRKSRPIPMMEFLDSNPYSKPYLPEPSPEPNPKNESGTYPSDSDGARRTNIK